MNALLFAAEARQCTVGTSAYNNHVYVKYETTQLEIYFRMKNSGELIMVVEVLGGSRIEYADAAKRPVEGRLNDFFVRLYAKVFDRRKLDRIEKARKEKHAMANLAYEELTQKRAVEAKKNANEAARIKVLVEESNAWQVAQNIRAYSAHVRNSSEDSDTIEITNWQEWANSVADQMDPTLRRIAAIYSRL